MLPQLTVYPIQISAFFLLLMHCLKVFYKNQLWSFNLRISWLKASWWIPGPDYKEKVVLFIVQNGKKTQSYIENFGGEVMSGLFFFLFSSDIFFKVKLHTGNFFPMNKKLFWFLPKWKESSFYFTDFCFSGIFASQEQHKWPFYQGYPTDNEVNQLSRTR